MGYQILDIPFLFYTDLFVNTKTSSSLAIKICIYQVFSPDILSFEVKTPQRCSGVFDVGLVYVSSQTFIQKVFFKVKP